MASQRRRLEKALRDCAETGVPDAVDLWPAVGGRVMGRRTSPETIDREGGHAGPRRRSWGPQLVPNAPLGWVLAAVSVLILGFGVYAAAGPVWEFYRQGLPGTVEPGSDEEPGRNLSTRPDENLSALRTELDQTRTADGVRVTLDWAYADERFVAVNLDVEELDRSRNTGGAGPGPDAALEPALWDDTVGDEAELPPYVKITDASGQDFDLVGGGTGLGPPRYEAAEAVFDAPEGIEPGTGHRFRLEVPIQEGPALSGRPEAGPFVFEFEVPVRPAPTIELDQKAEAEGITLTLEGVVDSPVLPQAVVCLDPPDDEYGWTPRLREDGYSIPGNDAGGEGILATAPQRLGGGCWSLMMGHTVETGSSVTVASLDGFPDGDSPRVNPKTIGGPWTFEFRSSAR